MASYRSKFEAELARQLKRAGSNAAYEEYLVPYVLEKHYVPDFVLPSGLIIEAKGVLSPADRQKMIAVKRCNPELDIRFVFQNANNRLRRGSPTTYAKWAERNGFPHAHEKIPKGWLD